MAPAVLSDLEASITLSINSLVVDEAGEPVPSATVAVLYGAHALYSQLSDTKGTIRFSGLSIKTGTYELRAAKAGYEAGAEELVVKQTMDKTTVSMVIRIDSIKTQPAPQLLRQQQDIPSSLDQTPHVLHDPSFDVRREPDDQPRKQHDAALPGDPFSEPPAPRMGWPGAKPKEPTPAPSPPKPAAPVAISDEQKFYRVRVFFATDRNERINQPPKKAFGEERSPEGKLSLGLCAVSIPKSHRVGQLEASTIFKLQVSEDPVQHVVIMELRKMREGYFLESLGMMAGQSPEQNALVFIHGYNVTFAEAIRRTAQLAFDLDFHGVPICYSWPSTGKYSGYMADEASVEWTVPHLTELLCKIGNLEGVKTIHLIAHSMGNRALVNCLDKIASQAQTGVGLKAKFQQAILAAPDMDAGVFRQLAQTFPRTTGRTTLYASSGDLALQVSQQFHQYPRAGESGPNIVVAPSIDTVDVSTVPSGFLGHSYYGQSRSVLADVYQLIKSGAPPPRFGLKQSDGPGDLYWIFVP